MITASGLTKRYDGFTALDDVSFSFPEAGIFGIVGHNGAGKTTLLKIIAGLVPPSAGELSVNGIDVVRAPMALKETLGYLPEESRLYETMTADEYLAFFGEIYGIEKEEIAVRTRRLFAVLSLEPNGKKLGEFSKGMKRKTAIARSLIHDPKFLVYDEPTSGLDPMTSRFIAEYLGKLKSEGRTIVLSAHNLYQVEAICDRVMILRRGKVVALGTMDELREQFGSITYTIWFFAPDPSLIDRHTVPYRQDERGLACDAGDMAGLEAVSAAITVAGGRVERIESRYPSLEEMLVAVGK
ncbi:MAG: ATP-binding cassette domain-containing protein [Methanoregula sp.]|uniref:ABC transporter ATP-binding protein n=1 Tax=Methanoregula sp. TaxID=2052170 RepID=UPI003C342187